MFKQHQFLVTLYFQVLRLTQASVIYHSNDYYHDEDYYPTYQPDPEFEILEQELQARILSSLNNPVISEPLDTFKRNFYPSNSMFQNYKELSNLNNSPSTNYSIDETNPPNSRMTRDLWQFGPIEVDRYKFTFNLHPKTMKAHLGDAAQNSQYFEKSKNSKNPKFSKIKNKSQLIDNAQIRIFKVQPENPSVVSFDSGSENAEISNFYRNRKFNQKQPERFQTAYLTLIDDHGNVFSSQQIKIHSSEWIKLDCTDFLKDRIQQRHLDLDRNDTAIDFNVLIESVSSHHFAIKSARKIRLIDQLHLNKDLRPNLAIHMMSGKRFLAKQEKYRNCENLDFTDYFYDAVGLNVEASEASAGNVEFSKPTKSCCKGSQTLDLSRVKWNTNWLIEPSYIKITKCGGQCQHPLKKCVPVEKNSLTIFYLSLNEYGEIYERVDVLPNFVVSRCACRFVL